MISYFEQEVAIWWTLDPSKFWLLMQIVQKSVCLPCWFLWNTFYWWLLNKCDILEFVFVHNTYCNILMFYYICRLLIIWKSKGRHKRRSARHSTLGTTSLLRKKRRLAGRMLGTFEWNITLVCTTCNSCFAHLVYVSIYMGSDCSGKGTYISSLWDLTYSNLPYYHMRLCLWFCKS